MYFFPGMLPLRFLKIIRMDRRKPGRQPIFYSH